MAGWSFTVTTQTLADYRLRLDREAILAQWTTGASGIGWIERLADGGWAERVETGGYPNTYTALAGDVVPLFGPDRPPLQDEPPRHAWAIDIRWEELQRLAPDQGLTIVVWDQS